MKKSKIIISSIMACSVVLSGNALAATAHAQSKVTHLDTNKPYYQYEGNLSSNPKTILDKKFINALNNDNISLNGYMVNKNRVRNVLPDKSTKVYDFVINKRANKVTSISWMPDKKIVNKKEVIDTYIAQLKFVNYEKFKNAYTTYHFKTKMGTKVDISFKGNNQ